MKKLMISAVVASALLAGGAFAQSSEWRTVAPENLWVIDTSKGQILVELEPRVAPNHVERIRTLTQNGFYDGLKFHRVIPGFMAQTGDPQGTGQGGSDLPDIAGEFSFRRGRDAAFAPVENAGEGYRGFVGSVAVGTQPDAQMFLTSDMKVNATPLFCGGAAGMARAASPNSANSQFFLMSGQNDALNGGYTVFGRVLKGMDVIKTLQPGSEAADGAVAANADTMTRARLASSLPESERPNVRVAVAGGAPFTQAIEAARSAKGASFNICDVEVPVQIG
jgi:cyclophilin family peptidyl-prolyl cis-trans isomerase